MPLTLSQTSKPPAIGEHELVAAARAGDDRAFEQLYSRYRDRILAFIASKVHDHARAEDIAQDVFMSALRRLRVSDQQIAFKPWIYEIAKNACIDEFRRGNRSREVPLETDGEFVTDRQPTLSVVATPPVAVEGKQRLEDLRGAFGGLSDNHHQLLVMREFEGMTYDEIGERMSMTRQMVESGLFRARRKLSEEYEELASGRRCEQVQGAIDAGTMQSVRALGLRERRRVARHLAHCQRCRHVALMAGVDQALVKPRSVAAKIAAFLPLPVWRWSWRGGRGGARATSASQHLAASGLPTAGATESAALGPAAAAVAVLALAGAGGGLVHALSSRGPAPRPAAATRAADGALQSGVAAGASGTAPSVNPALAGHGIGLVRVARGTVTFSPRRSSSSQRSQPRHKLSGSGGSVPPSSSGSASPSTSTTGVTRQAGGSAVAGAVGATASGTAQVLSKTVNGTLAGSNAGLSGVTRTASGVAGSTVSKVAGAVSNVAGTVSHAAAGAGSSDAGTVSDAANTVSNAVKPVANSVQPAASGVSTTIQHVTSGAGSAGSDPLVGPGASTGSQTVPTATQSLQAAASQLTNGLGSK